MNQFLKICYPHLLTKNFSSITALILTVATYIMLCSCMVQRFCATQSKRRRNIEQLREDANIPQPLTVEIPSAPTEQIEMAPLIVAMPSAPPGPRPIVIIF